MKNFAGTPLTSSILLLAALCVASFSAAGSVSSERDPSFATDPPVIYRGSVSGVIAPCYCLNNATNLANGQFQDTLTIESNPGEVWTIAGASGLYSTASPAPPAAPVSIAAGTLFPETAPGSGIYRLIVRYVDAMPYSVTVSNGIDAPLSLNNVACYYPNPQIISLASEYCITSSAVTLQGNAGAGVQGTAWFLVDGAPATEFDPAIYPQGSQHTVTYTFDAGAGTANNPGDPACSATVTQNVVISSDPVPVGITNFTLMHSGQGTVAVTPQMTLHNLNSYPCPDDFYVIVYDGNGNPIGNSIGPEWLGQALRAETASYNGVFLVESFITVVNEYCPTPTLNGATNITTATATLRWTSNDTPLDNCWVLSVGGAGMTLDGTCPAGGQALSVTTICNIGGILTWSGPAVTNVMLTGNTISVTVGGLPAGANLEYYVSETCDGIAAPDNVSNCAGPAAFQTLACPGDLVFASQAEIDAFPANYPACTQITGNITISGADITNLFGLAAIESITGTLLIENNPALNALNGLSALTSVGALHIRSNAALGSLAGLGGLTSAGSSIQIINNPLLQECEIQAVCNMLSTQPQNVLVYGNADGCANLAQVFDACGILSTCPGNITFTTQAAIDAFPTDYPGCVAIPGNVEIYGSDITNLDGLSGLISIGGGLIIQATSLNDLNGLESLTSIGSHLSIRNNNLLASLSGLDALIGVINSIEIYGNSVLANLSGLEGISGVFYLYIVDNTALIDLTGLGGLTSVGSLIIGNNSSLTSLAELSALTSIGWSLNISNNSSLWQCEIDAVCNFLVTQPANVSIFGNSSGCANTAQVQAACGITISCPGNITFTTQAEIDAFPVDYPGCVAIPGNVEITGQDITNLDGLSGLISIGGGLIIQATSLNDLNGLESLTSIGSHLSIRNNNLLASLSGLDALIGVINSIEIYGNSVLANLSGLEGISGVFYLYIVDNTALIDLTGLGGLTSVGSLIIGNNSSLTSLAELSALTSIGWSLNISNNSSLWQCEIDAVCNFLVTHPANVSIYGNSPGCANTAQVQAACINPPACPGSLVFTTQAQVDAFPTDYPGCTVIPGNVRIQGPGISNLSPLSGITSIGGMLYVANTVLSGLDGLSGLTSIGELQVLDNALLSSLAGLSALSSLQSLTIINNPNLSECDIQAVCNHLAVPANPANIWGNTYGCNDRPQIEAACAGCGVNDTEAPMLSCHDLTITFNGEYSIYLDPNQLATATDNCGLQNLALSAYYVYYWETGLVPITVTATDLTDNTSTCLSNLTVLNTAQAFVTVWQTNNAGTSAAHQITIPGTGSNYHIQWEEVGNPGNNGTAVGNNATTLSFPWPGTYRVAIQPGAGSFTRIRFNNAGDRSKLLHVEQWGAIPWTSMEGAFWGCHNLNVTASDMPNLSGVSSMASMFRSCSNLSGPYNIGNWNTASVTDMRSMFEFAGVFDQYIGSWNTGAVTNMSQMFFLAEAFNQPIGGWNTSAVTDMSGMFAGAKAFNQYIGDWNTAAVTDMSGMFFLAGAFNQPIGNWSTGAVRTMQNMFLGAARFNQYIGGWNTSAVTDMSGMFFGALAFQQDIGGWSTAAVTDMSRMFNYAVVFNQPIGGWNTGSVVYMSDMFAGAAAFNQPIGSWNTAAVRNMSDMFAGAGAFNQPLDGWQTSAVTDMSGMFQAAGSFNQNLGGWTLHSDVILDNMLDGSGMDCSSYSATLMGWSGNAAAPDGRNLGAAGRLYSIDAEAARTHLLLNKDWVINGDAPAGNRCVPCPDLSTAPPNVLVVNSTCGAGCVPTGGSIGAPTGTPCPEGSILQYQVNGGAWSTTLPEYALNGPPQTIRTRCVCEADDLVSSPVSVGVTTTPANCTDNTPPTMACMNSTVHFTGQTSISLNLSNLATVSDNCGIQSVTMAPNVIYAYQIGQVVSVTVTAMDINGNTASCLSQVTVTGSGGSQCATPTINGTTNIGTNSATLIWTSNDTPMDKCWVLTVGGAGMTVGAGNCPWVGQALLQTMICNLGGTPTWIVGTAVMAVTVTGNVVAVNVGGLPPGTTLQWFVSEICDIASPYNASLCAGSLPFQTLDDQYTVTAAAVAPSCSFASPGYEPNGTFTVTVATGTTCFGTYTVSAAPVAGSGPGGSTPPLTTPVVYTGLDHGHFTFHNAGVGSYTVTVTEISGCNMPTNPVVVTVVVPNGTDITPPVFYVTDVLGNILADNDPQTPQGTTLNFGNVTIPEGACGRQDQFFVYGFDNCDGPITAQNAVSAITTGAPATQVSVMPDGFGLYLVDVHWSIGQSTIVVTAQDAAGNIANGLAGLQLIANILDEVEPVVTILGSNQVTIPLCGNMITQSYTVIVDDLCEPDLSIGMLTANNGATVQAQNQAGNQRVFDVTFPAAGNYVLTYTHADATGNIGSGTLIVAVQQAAANQPPVIVANAVTVTLMACQNAATIVYSFTIQDDCEPINMANVQFNGGGSGLPNLNGSGFFYTEPIGTNTVYFEVYGTVGPAGTYFPIITYNGVTASPTITVDQMANQPADIALPAIYVTIPQCASSVDVIMPITIYDDCDNPINLNNVTISLGGVNIPVLNNPAVFANAAAGYIEISRTLTAVNNGQLLSVAYTDGHGAVNTANGIVTVSVLSDTWAPIMVFPSQDIIVDLFCDTPNASITFSVSAHDNCQVASLLVSLMPGGQILTPTTGTTYEVTLPPGTHTVTLIAADLAGNTRQEEFRIIINQFDGVNFTATPVPGSCGGTGQIQVDISSGTAPYVLTWTGPVNGSITLQANGYNIPNLPAGTYQIGVSDSRGCASETTVVMAGTPDILAPIIIYPAQDIVANLACGDPTAMISFEASASDNCQVASFVVSVMPGGQILTPVAGTMYEVTLPLGTHTILLVATDQAGNIRQEDFRIIVNSLTAANFTTTPVPGTCGQGGRIEISNISGAAPFTITWTGPVSGSATTSLSAYNLSNLPSGSYNVTVTGANQCSSQASVALSNLPNTLSFDASPSPGSCGQYGSILLQISNDPGPYYVIQWSGPISGSVSTNSALYTISNLLSGNYSISVTGQCTQAPVTANVTLQNSSNTTPPIIYVTDMLGNLLADNDPGTSASMMYNFGTTPTSATSCILNETYYVFGVDDCDDFLAEEGTIGAYVSVNPVGTQVIVAPGDPGFYEVYAFWGAGNSTIVINARDLSGNETPDIVLTRTLSDNTPPIINCMNDSVQFNGQASITLNPNDLATASDNCGIQSVVLTPNTILSNQVGQVVPVTVMATDMNGNTAQCISEITVTGLPSGWASDSISVGGVTTVTTYNPATGEWDVTATGGFYGPPYDSDAIAFTHRTLCGNGSITTLVTDISGGQGWAGVVMRETNAVGSKKAQLMTNLSNFSRREFRIETNGPAYPQQFPSQNRYWLRIVRTGAQFSLYTSLNGVAWYPAGAQSIQMNACIQMGLVVTNYTANSTVTATFSNVSYTGSSTPGLMGAAVPNLALDTPEHVEFGVFPNPTTGRLSLDLEQYVGRQIRIEAYSLQGNLLRFSEVSEVQIPVEQLDLSGFADGMYLIRVKSPGWPDAVQRVVLHARN